MKNLLITLAIIVVTGLAQSSIAADGEKLKVNNLVLEAFNRDFILTSNANWHKIDDLLAVDFTQSGIFYTAYYTQEGILTTICNTIEKARLPLAVSAKVQRKFINAEILKVVQVRSVEKGISYVIQMVVDKQHKIVKIDEKGAIEKIRRI